ncbi:MAG: ATP-binding cassette domain-containing protein [Alphaproteobacteria bacterium]|nr:ATP-binding cassette domain-containing protein [Alphaproteobacteria bacterium]MBV9692850.1 ATP-binding cassette domain-containing protein [Alphaproteobacteria bacterium]
MESAIVLDEVSVTYPGGERPALDRVSLAVPEGRLLVLVGESGSGKTTTLHLINRLIVPDRGRVLVLGRDIAGVDGVALRRGIGFVFQSIGLFPHMSVAANIAVTPSLLGWPQDDVAARVNELLTLVGLAPEVFSRRSPASLSGGQQQRVGLARALAARPAIMLMDEPFGALDPLTRDELSAEVRAIHDRLGLTTVLVTHDMTEALLLADLIGVMRDGRLVQVGTPEALLARPADDGVRALFEHPRRRTEELARALHLAPGV